MPVAEFRHDGYPRAKSELRRTLTVERSAIAYSTPRGRPVNGINCQQSERLWRQLLAEKKAYKEALEKEFQQIRERNLDFQEYEKNISRAQRRYTFAKMAVLNHHKLHGCAEHLT